MVALSSTKDEYIATTHSSKEAVYCNNYAQKLGLNNKLLGWNVIVEVQSS